jgi:hypothetical protein
MRKLLPADHGLLPRIMSAASTPEKAAHRLLLCQYAATVIGPTQEQQRSSRVGNHVDTNATLGSGPWDGLPPRDRRWLCTACPGDLMASIYDTFADSFAALAARTKRESDKVHLLQLADQWRTVPADRLGPGRKPPVPATLASATENAVPLLARPTPPVCMPKSASDPINDRKKQLESKPKWGEEMALVRAREAIGVLRELEIDDDAILNALGFTAERVPKKAATHRSGRKLVPLVSKQNGFSPAARHAAHKARQARAARGPRR